MKQDARVVVSGSEFRADVCVVGGGPAGLAVASRLASSGRSVCLVEAGGDEPAPWRPWTAGGHVTGLPYCRIRRPGRGGPGGNSWFWMYKDRFPRMGGGFRSRPLEPIDFEERSWVPNSGWPISAFELQPAYAEAHQLMGLVGGSYAAGVWADESHQPGTFSHGLESSVYQYGDPFTFQRIATQVAGSAQVRLLQHAHVVAIEAGQTPGEVVSIRVAAEGGGWSRVAAREFVLAAGGIENPRLLLLSSFGKPGAPGNRFDQVGRYYMEHPFIETGELRETPYASEKLAFYRRHRTRGTQALGVFRISDDVQRRDGLLNTTVEIQPRQPVFSSRAVRSFQELKWGLTHWSRPEESLGHARNVLREPQGIARATALRLTGRLERNATLPRLVFSTEQVPNPHSRVNLGSQRDHFGLLRPHLDWRVLSLDSDSVGRTQSLIDREFREAGFGPLSELWNDTEPNPRRHGCWHNIGTTRMSASPERGVVDADCRVYGMRNLWMAGSSVMPTAGAATITLTLVALSLRLAGTLDQQLQ